MTVTVVRSHRDLDVYWKAMDLVDEVYDLTDAFPRWENFGLRSQLTRAASSVPANIAEGAARATSKEFAHFLSVARSSLMEIDAHLEVAARRSYVSRDSAAVTYGHLSEVARMLASLRTSVIRRNRSNHQPPATNH